MNRKYEDRILTAEQNLYIFRKSLERCDVPVMLENSFIFLETIKNANNFYFSLPVRNQKASKNSYNKSQALLQKYFDLKSQIGSSCKCKISR